MRILRLMGNFGSCCGNVAVRVGEEKGRVLFVRRTQGSACQLGGFLVVPKCSVRADF